jgi:phage-related tail protein
VQERHRDLLHDWEEARAKVAELSESLEPKEEAIRKLQSQLEQVQFTMKRAQLKSQGLIDQVERQKKLLEVQVKAKLIAAETEFNVRMEDLRHEWQKERANLFAYMAEQFQMFFDASIPIDETSFKQIVGRVKNEFDRQRRQESAIRKLVKAKESQTTAEALMELMVMHHLAKPAC